MSKAARDEWGESPTRWPASIGLNVDCPECAAPAGAGCVTENTECFRWEHGNAICRCGHLAETHQSQLSADQIGLDKTPCHDDCPCKLTCDEVMRITCERVGAERWPNRSAFDLNINAVDASGCHFKRTTAGLDAARGGKHKTTIENHRETRLVTPTTGAFRSMKSIKLSYVARCSCEWRAAPIPVAPFFAHLTGGRYSVPQLREVTGQLNRHEPVDSLSDQTRLRIWHAKRQAHWAAREHVLSMNPRFDSPLVILASKLTSGETPDHRGIQASPGQVFHAELIAKIGKVHPELLAENMVYFDKRLEALRGNHRGRSSYKWLLRWQERVMDELQRRRVKDAARYTASVDILEMSPRNRENG